ncbi:MAG: helix-turn-helix transcriptional regulator [Clostridia bacterium]|nr:helix-turn-helix transcriptional regulator [Clostridia bacterium]
MNDAELILKNNVKKIRQEKGYSQEELAKKVGTTRQTIISIEKNVFCPTARLALLLSIALETRFEDLFFF